MKKVYCVICVNCGKYRKFTTPIIAYIFGKTLVISFICSIYENEGEKIF